MKVPIGGTCGRVNAHTCEHGKNKKKKKKWQEEVSMDSKPVGSQDVKAQASCATIIQTNWEIW